MKGQDLYELLRNAGALPYSKEPKETEDGTVLTGDFQVIANKNYNVDTNELVYTGAELIRTAIDDWAGFSEGDEKLMDWFPELGMLLPNKKYKTDRQLNNIEEIAE
jgi:hypothetical protein